MASILCRTVSNVARRTATLTSVRCMSDQPYVNPHRGKVASDKCSVPDGLGAAVGPERFEMLAQLAGNMDPFGMEAQPRRAGTKDDPTLVASQFEKRLVGCLCEEDSMNIKYMWLHKGEQKRCYCGYWFKLVDMPYVDYGQ